MIFRAIYKRHRKNMSALKKWKMKRVKRSQPSYVVLNEAERDLYIRPVNYTLSGLKEGECYVIYGAVSADVDGSLKDAALCGLIFIGTNGKRVEAHAADALSFSSAVGYYKYIKASRKPFPFNIRFTVPAGCTSTKVKIRPWKTRSGSLVLQKHAHITREIEAKSPKIRLLLEDAHAYITGNPFISIEKAASLTSRYVSDYGIAAQDVAAAIFREYNQTTPHAVAGFGAVAFYEKPQRLLYEDVYVCLHRAGFVYEKYNYLRKAVAAGFLNDGDLRLRKSEEETRHLKQGFPMPAPAREPAYIAERSALYLLHNSLPYNSGGYATRTHGLLSNIRRESGFSVAAMTRPGFPSDHEAHISTPLPKPLPEKHLIDDVDYVIGDQELRRSKITSEEYIQQFSDRVCALAHARKACVIHAASNHPNGLTAVRSARLLGITSVYEVRGLWEITRMSRDELWGRTEQFALAAKLEVQALQEADFGLTITHALKNMMQDRGVTKEIHVVPNGVDTAAFSPIPKDINLARELDIEERVVIGYAGSVVNYEGLDDLLHALSLLVQRGITNIVALIVGDGAYHQTLKKLAAELNIQDYIVFTGRVPHTEVQRYLSIMDIMPFPRKPFLVCETVSPIKPMEAMAVGKATLFSSCAAMLEMVEDGVTGMVFEKGNRSDFADKLHTLIESEALRRTLGDNALKWVRRERDWRTISAIVTDIYREAYERTARNAK